MGHGIRAVSLNWDLPKERCYVNIRTVLYIKEIVWMQVITDSVNCVALMVQCLKVISNMENLSRKIFQMSRL